MDNKLFCLLLSVAFFGGCAEGTPGGVSPEVEDRYRVMGERIDDYLEENVAIRGFNGTPSCAHELLGGDEEHLYLWTLCQEYYPTPDSLATGSGSSLPVSLSLSGDRITTATVPGDGAAYERDVRTVFPKDVVTVILSDKRHEIVSSLTSELRERKREMTQTFERDKALFEAIFAGKESADFYGAGSEPFWTLYLKNDRLLFHDTQAVFGYELLNTFDPEKERQTLGYRQDFSPDTFFVTLVREPTLNDMAGQTFPYAVIRDPEVPFVNGVGDLEPLR